MCTVPLYLTFSNVRDTEAIFVTALSCNSQRWATVFREESLQHNIITNNGVGRLNDMFKYRHLEKCKTSTISEMMTVIVSDFIPQLQKK